MPPFSPDLKETEIPLSLKICHSFADVESVRVPWDELVVRSGADVYQTFDWCKVWWEHYQDGRELELLCFYSDHELVGVIPAFVETIWLGPAYVRAAKLVGTDFTLHLCNLSVLSTALRRVISATINHFLGARGCDVLLIGPLSGPSARIDEIADVARDQHDPVQRVDALGDTCTTYFHLPASFDEYLNSLSKQQRYNFTRKMTQLSKAHKVRCDVVSAPDEVMAEFEAFRELHETQWRREGKLGHFGDWPRGEDFNRQLVRTLGPRGMVRFHRIMADAEVVSSQFSFAFGGTTYWRLPARASATEWDRFSFGWLGLAKLFEASIQEGRCIVEGGRGHYAYKLQLGGREWPLRTLQVVRRGRGVAERLRAFRFFARQLDIAYYKIVFARLAPRMPLLRRRLWPLWIRSTW